MLHPEKTTTPEVSTPEHVEDKTAPLVPPLSVSVIGERSVVTIVPVLVLDLKDRLSA